MAKAPLEEAFRMWFGIIYFLAALSVISLGTISSLVMGLLLLSRGAIPDSISPSGLPGVVLARGAGSSFSALAPASDMLQVTARAQVATANDTSGRFLVSDIMHHNHSDICKVTVKSSPQLFYSTISQGSNTTTPVKSMVLARSFKYESKGAWRDCWNLGTWSLVACVASYAMCVGHQPMKPDVWESSSCSSAPLTDARLAQRTSQRLKRYNSGRRVNTTKYVISWLDPNGRPLRFPRVVTYPSRPAI